MPKSITIILYYIISASPVRSEHPFGFPVRHFKIPNYLVLLLLLKTSSHCLFIKLIARSSSAFSSFSSPSSSDKRRKKMIAAHSSVRSVSGFFFATTPDQTNATTSRLVSKSLGSSPVQSLSMRLCCSTERCRSPKSFLLSCKSSRGSSGGRRSSNRNDDHDHDFLQASLLVPGFSFSPCLSVFMLIFCVGITDSTSV